MRWSKSRLFMVGLCLQLLFLATFAPGGKAKAASKSATDGFIIQADRVVGTGMNATIVQQETSAKSGTEPMLRIQYQSATIYGMRLIKQVESSDGMISIALKAQGPVTVIGMTVDTTAISFKGACLAASKTIPNVAMENVTMVAHYMKNQSSVINKLVMDTAPGQMVAEMPNEIQLLTDLSSLSPGQVTKEIQNITSGHLPLTCPDQSKTGGTTGQSGNITDPLKAALGGAANPLVPVVKTLDPVLTTLNPVLGTLNPVLGTLNPVLGTLNPVLGTLNPVLGTLNPVLGTLNPVLGTLNPVLGTLNPVLGTLSPVLSPLAPVLSPVNPVINQLNPVSNQAGSVINKLSPVIKPVAPVAGIVSQAAGQVTNQVNQAASQVTTKVSQAANQASNQGSQSNGGGAKVSQTVSQAVSQVSSTASQTTNQATQSTPRAASSAPVSSQPAPTASGSSGSTSTPLQSLQAACNQVKDAQGILTKELALNLINQTMANKLTLDTACQSDPVLTKELTSWQKGELKTMGLLDLLGNPLPLDPMLLLQKMKDTITLLPKGTIIYKP